MGLGAFLGFHGVIGPDFKIHRQATVQYIQILSYFGVSDQFLNKLVNDKVFHKAEQTFIEIEDLEDSNIITDEKIDLEVIETIIN